MANLGSLSGAFLGINVSTDDDGSAWGGKGVGLPMPTTFRVYGMIHTIEKDMVYAHSLDDNKVLTHRFHNETFTRAYTTAFLHKHLNFNQFYSAFLKHQALPSSIGALLTIVQQHEDRAGERIVAADFGKFSTPTISITNGVIADIVDSYVVDEFSPHQARVLRIKWDRTTSPANITSNRVSLTYVPGFQVGDFNLLSFRLGQGVPSFVDPQAFDVRIHLNNKSVLLSAVAGLIQPPIPVKIPLGDATKTIMRTFVIPLSSFGGVGSTISAIRFDFGVNPASPMAKSTFYLDSVQFWKP